MPLTIRRITSEWPFVTTTTCGATLVPAASCGVTLVYAPLNQVGAASIPPPFLTDAGTLVIESDAVSSPDLIDLTGSSTPATVASPSNAAPLVAFTPSQSSLTFANTTAGTASAPQSVTLDNTGTATLNILGIQTTPDFTVVNNCSTIIPGASCVLTATFTPQTSTQQGAGSGMRIGAIEISSNASTSLEFVSLVGVSSPSALAVSPASLNFDTVLVGTSSTLAVQLNNTGSTPISLSAVTAAGDYTTAAGSCPAPGSALAAGTSCGLQVTFAPTQSGTRTGSLAIANSATALPLTLPLTGTGIQSQLLIAPASLSFGSIAVGASTSLSLTLVNTGTAPITGIALAVTGDYAVSVPCALTKLVSGGSCSVTLTFTPTATGTRPGTLIVTSSDVTSPTGVPLTGGGNAIMFSGSFTFIVSGSNAASAAVSAGSPAAYKLTITPLNGFAGTVILNCTPVDPATYASCSLLPASVMLSGTAQTAVAALNTVTSIAAIPTKSSRSFGDTALCLLFPVVIFTWKARTSRYRARRVVGPVAWAIFASIGLLAGGGCGGSKITPSNLRYAAAGTYQYQVTANGTSGSIPVVHTVILNLTVQ
jgi:hypothetical protein